MASILIVEDTEDTAELIERIVNARGHVALLAADGETALQMAANHQTDLVILDLGLPDIDGPTVITQLRRIPGRQHVPILVVTAWPEETARKVVAAYGCNGYLAKPIHIAELSALIDLHLNAALSA
jgi:DNA-binding response OmpR family regulator